MKDRIKKRAVRRLKILEGQIRGLQKMVESGKYCIDILNQSTAVRKALSAFEDLILEGHLSSHVVDQIKSGKEKRAVGEMLKIYKASKNK